MGKLLVGFYNFLVSTYQSIKELTCCKIILAVLSKSFNAASTSPMGGYSLREFSSVRPPPDKPFNLPSISSKVVLSSPKRWIVLGKNPDGGLIGSPCTNADSGGLS